MTNAPKTRLLAGLLLAVLVLLLAVRLTQSESIRETLSQKFARLAARPGAPGVGDDTPTVGPAVISAEAAVAFLVAAAAAAVAAFSTGLSGRRVMHFVGVAAVVGVATVSAVRAENRFAAAVGVADLAAALAAGWAVSLLVGLLGDGGRRAVVAGLVAIGTLWVGKGLLQKFVEFPDVAAYVREHHDEMLRAQGVDLSDPVQVQLFESRMNSREVSGYLAFSNVFATGLIGLLGVLAASLAAWGVSRRASPEPAAATKRAAPRAGGGGEAEIPLDAIWAGLAVLVLAAGLYLLPSTGSKGGAVLGFAAVGAIAAGTLLWRGVYAWRRALVVAGVVALAAGAAGVVGYGLTRDALPSKSLLFRWQYWTGAAPMIRGEPLWGVGLNNFGDYYMAFKRPSAPEDVKDPHNFFVRLAAEAGLPAAGLALALMALHLHGAFRSRRTPAEAVPAGEPSSPWPALAAAGGCGLLWVVIHLGIAEAAADYNIYMSLIFAAVAVAGFGAAYSLLGAVAAAPRGAGPGMRGVAAGAAVAAVAMLVYDQINMALVTGPVAMLFWMLLGFADADDALGVAAPAAAGAEASPLAPASAAPARPRQWSAVPALLASTLCTGAALILIMALWQPTLAGTMPWDPSPYEAQYARAMAGGDWRSARSALEAALARAPRSLELRMHHISLLRDQLHEPVAPEIRQAVALDRANAGIRLTLALPTSDLPAGERAALLREALALDDQLPADELKRLPAAKREQAEALIRALEGSPQTQR
jgi:hypothetical protein